MRPMVETRISFGPGVFAAVEDERFALDVRGGRLFLGSPAAFYRLQEWPEIRRNDVLIWTARTAAFLEQNPSVLELAKEAEMVVLPRDDTALPPDIAALRRLEWTNARDVNWQWRVALGALPNHIRRPKH